MSADMFGAAPAAKAMGGHESARHDSEIWLTPPHILGALGEFDLDPCACPNPRPWDTAKKHLTISDNGLSQQWRGRVWLNPPYGREATKWLGRLKDHGKGTALIFARTETRQFFDHVWGGASALLFLRGRLVFCRPDGKPAGGNAGAPSVLVAYGADDAQLLKASGLDGAYVDWSEK